ncbi:tyrosine-protein phosphatase siw14 [Blastocladiella emersonii ATCC 22665]|nr:tyrosine-protein phosphatase siw14 [Blastocladiella emersonii ATCC 22665]
MAKTVLVPPLNFAMVASGVYRSGYPNRKNFAFLRTLGLKSIVYLDPEEYRPDNVEFVTAEGITVFQYAVKGNKEPFQEIDEADVRGALERLLDPANRPILIHCNKGKHRIGCVVGCLRKLQRWSMTSIFDEYRRFAGEKIRIADQEFIEVCDVSAVRYARDPATRHAFPGLFVGGGVAGGGGVSSGLALLDGDGDADAVGAPRPAAAEEEPDAEREYADDDVGAATAVMMAGHA